MLLSLSLASGIGPLFGFRILDVVPLVRSCTGGVKEDEQLEPRNSTDRALLIRWCPATIGKELVDVAVQILAIRIYMRIYIYISDPFGA